MKISIDQFAKADEGKPQLSLVPMKKTLEAVARVREYGNKKYHDPDNWRTVDVSRYKDALMRHLLAFLDDAGSRDDESGLLHLDHALCNMFFIKELQK